MVDEMSSTYIITQEGLEKVWEAVQDLSKMRRDRIVAWDKPETHAKYWNAKQRLVEVVMKTFGEDWGDVKVGQKEI
jgi:hypothetical protein